MVPISEMGNYQEALAKKQVFITHHPSTFLFSFVSIFSHSSIQVLRRIDDEDGADNLKKAYFGNPYRQKVRQMGAGLIDEADDIGGIVDNRRNLKKRSILALPGNYTLLQQRNQVFSLLVPFSLNFL